MLSEKRRRSGKEDVLPRRVRRLIPLHDAAGELLRTSDTPSLHITVVPETPEESDEHAACTRGGRVTAEHMA